MSTDRETSIRRGAEVLLALGAEDAVRHGGLGVMQISELLGREKSQVSRTLRTLAEYGLVERNPRTLAYRPGWRIYALAQLAGESRLLEASRPNLTRLVSELGECAHLSVLQGSEILTLLSEAPPSVVQAVTWVGRASPAYCTSAGRVLLVDYSPQEVVRVFEGCEFRRRGPNTPGSVNELLKRIEQARFAGYAVADEEFEPGLVAIAAPIRGPDGRIIAALNVSGPKFRFGERLDEAIASVVETSSALSHALGEPAAGDTTEPL